MSHKNRINVDRIPITLFEGATFEEIVAQIQPYLTDTIVVVVNGEKLVLHTGGDKSRFPVYVELEIIKGDIYYFRDKVTDDLYALFGGEAATIFCPSLNRGVTQRKVASICDDGNVTTVLDEDIEPALVSEREVKLLD